MLLNHGNGIMKTTLVLTMLLGLVLSSCNNEATVTISEDSAKNKVQVTEDKLDSTAESIKDSAKAKWREIKDKVENKLENTDSTKK